MRQLVFRSLQEGISERDFFIFQNQGRNEVQGMSKENRSAEQERISRQNKEKCAAFIAKMIEKYGKEVLKEIEEKERETSSETPTTM